MKLLKNKLKFIKHSHLFLFALLIGISQACSNHVHTIDQNGVCDNPSYAKWFTITHYDQFTEITIKNPWDSTKYLHKYALVPKDKNVPNHIPREDIIVRTPLNNIACYYSIHVGMINKLGALSTIKAVAEPQYIFIPEVHKRLDDGSIISIGESTSPDFEKLVMSSPEAIMVSPFENTGYGIIEKIGIPIIAICDYMETTPLGRMEWIKLIGLLIGKEDEANRLFDETTERYNKVAAIASKLTDNPTVFSEMKTGQVWYVPGGNSYMGVFYRDAGADYLWKDTSETGSLTLSYETVFEKGAESDIWIIKYTNEDHDMTYSDLANIFNDYTLFKSFKNKKIIGCNTGKNHYFEEGTLEPDVVLCDFVNLFHPGVINHTQKYFKWMTD